MYISLNGNIIKKEEALISPYDHGFLYGIGLFETIRVYHRHPFLFYDHIDRLNEGLKMIGIQLNKTKEEWFKDIQELLISNKMNDAYVRINVSGGVHELGLNADDYTNPTVIIFVKSLPSSSPDEKEGIILKTARNSPETIKRLKSHHFLNNMLAKREIGNDIKKEGIFLNEQGMLAEGIVSNIFWAKDGIVYTPSVETGILNGITRQFVIELLKKRKLCIRKGSFEPSHLLSADEAFMTNSIQEIVPFASVENINFPGNNGEITQILLNDYKVYRTELWSYKQLIRRSGLGAEC